MGMIDLAKTSAEVKEEADERSDSSPARLIEKYPWGLSVSFDQDTLDKLGLSGSLPDVGSTFKFSAEAKITSISSSESETAAGDSESKNRVEAQIVRMSVGDDAQKPRARNWYGSTSDTNKDGE